MVSPSKEHLEKHYEDLSSKPFFPGLVTCKVITLSDILS
jgi:nucleoside-diphosphate kinase